MEIIECTADFSTERMYCPSTGEIIYSPAYQRLETDAEAFIAFWDAGYLKEPCINDPSFETAWEEYFEKVIGPKMEKREYIWEDFRSFLLNYPNENWIVFECDIHSMACGPVTTTQVFVVKEDTIIEEDPDFDAEEEEEKLKNMSEEEFTNMVIGRQLGALTRAMEKDENKKKKNKKE